MIKVHSYCSYKHSPSGFVYGSFEVGEKTDNADYYLSDENNNSIVQTAFENGIIRRLCGKIPDSHNYIFLIRKLKYNYGNDHSDIGREVQMNFAFEFDSFSEFLSFICGYYSNEEQDAPALNHQLADCIIPDKSVDTYKYRISKNALTSWITSIKQPLSNVENEQNKKYKNSIYITASSANTDYTEQIQDLFKFPNLISEQPVELRRENNSANYYYPIKKKIQFSKKQQQVKEQRKNLGGQKKKIYLLILIIVIMVVALLVVICGILSSSQQNQSEINSIRTVMTNDIIDDQTVPLVDYSSSLFQIL